jgi:hypothetical protein
MLTRMPSVPVFIVHLKTILCLSQRKPLLVPPIFIIDIKKGEKHA